MFVGTAIWSEKLLWMTEWQPSGVRKMRNHTEWRNSAIQKSNIPLPVSSTGQSVWLLIIRLRVRVAYRKFFYLWGHMIGDDEDEMICSTRVPMVLCGPFQNKLSAAVLLKSKFVWSIVFYSNFDLVFAFSKEMGIVRKEKKRASL